MGKIRVLIVDDSASIRQALSEVLSSDPDIDVMGTAGDPYVAARRIQDEIPDVIMLDVEMPRMDGITFLRKLMSQRPLPVIICSSLVEPGSQVLTQAMEAGAVDVILKPRMGTRDYLIEAQTRICDTVKAAALAKIRGKSSSGKAAALSEERLMPSKRVQPKLNADAMLPPPIPNAQFRPTEKIICIGASTGGTESLRTVLEYLPATTPGIVIVQHMPESFTTTFARRLDSLCQMRVKEAEDGDAVLPGQVLIAPGNFHVLLRRQSNGYVVDVKEGPLVSRHRPSVDVLFRSAARAAGPNALGVIMTGMGDDGAQGLLEMRQAGAITIAEHESTCVVFGMPKEAISRGGAQHIIPLSDIAAGIQRLCH